jgi:hypothetical protein
VAANRNNLARTNNHGATRLPIRDSRFGLRAVIRTDETSVDSGGIGSVGVALRLAFASPKTRVQAVGAPRAAGVVQASIFFGDFLNADQSHFMISLLTGPLAEKGRLSNVTDCLRT